MKGIGISLIILTIVILLSANYSAAEEAKSKTWVYNDLKEFKQYILPAVKNISYSKSLTREEWEMVHRSVLNEQELDSPIHIANWAILIKMILDPDKGKNNGEMLDGYVYKLSTGNNILREDAVGGLVKLLTSGYIKGSVSAEEISPAKALKDLNEISDRQLVLVQMAFCEGILDSQSVDMFRPKDKLTNAEAISILNKVVKKYNIQYTFNINFIQNHWACSSISSYLTNMQPKTENVIILSNIAKLEVNVSVDSYSKDKRQTEKSSIRINSIEGEYIKNNILDNPIQVQEWNQLLMGTLIFDNSKYDRAFLETYTFGLSDGNYITRDKAVAGMVKLLHAAELVKGRDATQEEILAASKYYYDFDNAFDKSKLSIAHIEGLINGFGDNYFYPQKLLTKGEAITLVSRVAEKYYTRKETNK